MWLPEVKPYETKYETPYYKRREVPKVEKLEIECPKYNKYWSGQYDTDYLKKSNMRVKYVDPTAINYGRVGTNHGHVNDDATVVIEKGADHGVGLPDDCGDCGHAYGEVCDECDHEHGCAHGDDVCNMTDEYIEEEYVEPEPVDKFAKALSWAHGWKTCQTEGRDAYGQTTGAHGQYTCQGPAVYSRAHLQNPYMLNWNTWPVYGASWGHGRGLETMGGHGYGDHQ